MAGLFGMDPYRQQQFGLMLAGLGGGMAGTPRMAGWSAPFGNAAQGLAQMMPYMARLQQQQQEQQQQQMAMQQLQQSMQGLPNMEGNPYGPIIQSLSKSPYGAEEALKLIGPMAAWTPPEDKAPATAGYTYWDSTSKTWKTNEAALRAAEEAAAAGRQPVQAPDKIRILQYMGIDPKSPRGQQFLMGESGGYAGTSTDATDLNNIKKGMNDPTFAATPDYALSYNNLYQKPQWRQTMTASGMLLEPIMPTIPQGVPEPGAKASPPAGFPRLQDQSAAAQPQQASPGVQPSPYLVPGSEPKPTVQQERARVAATATAGDFEIAKQTFSAMTNFEDRVVGNVLPQDYTAYGQSEDYQRGEAAIRNIVTNFVSLSGRTGGGNEGLFNRYLDNVMPKPGEGKVSLAEKWTRLQNMQDAINSKGGNVVPPPPDGYELDQ